MPRNIVRFLLDGEAIALDAPDPTGTVLDLLRYRLRRTGTKEGCAEGDCGACTVLLGEPDGTGVAWRAVNACILFLPMLDGRALLTVESLGGVHPVQRELVRHHGSQCGFCTPGFVMSLYGRAIGAQGTDRPLADVVAGNLCRCTGYGPILAAGDAVPSALRDDAATATALAALRDDAPLAIVHADPVDGTTRRAFVARDADELAALLLDHPAACIVAGATDVGLWVTKQLRDEPLTIFVGNAPDLRTIGEDVAGVHLGAAATYTAARPALARLAPALDELLRRTAGVQVRNVGTIGGNIANGSPIGDMPPALIALDARLTLRRGDERREIALEDFFIAYGRQDLRASEFVESVFVPRPAPGTLVHITKLSKRFDSDISAVCGAFAVTIDDGRVTHARIAFGGMAATPRRAPECEAALIGRPWSDETITHAVTALRADYAPLTDVRGSSAYRTTAAGNLLRRLWLSTQPEREPLSVLELPDG